MPFFFFKFKVIYHGLISMCYDHRVILAIVLEAVTGIAILILIEKASVISKCNIMIYYSSELWIPVYPK